MSPLRTAPGPRGARVLGVILARSRDPFQVMLDLRARYGPVVRIQVGRTSHFLVSDPTAARRVLVDNHRNYGKGPGYALWGRVLGRGLVTSDGERWRSHRRLVQPSLHPDRLERAVEIMARVVEEEAHRMAAAGPVTDVYDHMTRIALRVAARAFLGTDVGEREDDVCRALTRVFDHVQSLSASPLRALAHLPGASVLAPLGRAWSALRNGGADRTFHEALATLDQIIGDVVDRRRAALARGESSDDLVARLLQAAGTGDVELTDRDIRDEVMTMFVAGHETTATGLAWCLHLLATHPEHQEAVAREARSRLGDRPMAWEDVPHLPRTRRTFQESLRLFPPVWRVSRRAAGPDQLGEWEVPAGSIVIVSPYLVHRDPALWPEPGRFDPDRFLPDPPAAGAREAYLPFGAGPRMCPGGGFATVEAQVVLSTLCRTFTFEPAHPDVPAFDPALTLRPRGGMPLRLGPPASSSLAPR